MQKNAFENFVFYLMICAHSNERSDLLNKIKGFYLRDLEKDTILNKYVSKFLIDELMPLEETQVTADIKNYEPFADKTENHKLHYNEFVRQIIQHNLRVLEKYYERIALDRLAHLIGVSANRAEDELADMVVNDRISAKINRINRIVAFGKKKEVDDLLDDWNSDIKELLN